MTSALRTLKGGPLPPDVPSGWVALQDVSFNCDIDGVMGSGFKYQMFQSVELYEWSGGHLGKPQKHETDVRARFASYEGDNTFKFSFMGHNGQESGCNMYVTIRCSQREDVICGFHPSKGGDCGHRPGDSYLTVWLTRRACGDGPWDHPKKEVKQEPTPAATPAAAAGSVAEVEDEEFATLQQQEKDLGAQEAQEEAHRARRCACPHNGTLAADGKHHLPHLRLHNGTKGHAPHHRLRHHCPCPDNIDPTIAAAIEEAVAKAVAKAGLSAG